MDSNPIPLKKAPVTVMALTEDDPLAAARVEAAPLDAGASALGGRRLVALGAAVVVGVPATVMLSRFVTTIVLSLILGH